MRKVKEAPCTSILVAANIIIFLWLSIFGMTEDAGYMLSKGAMYVPYILEESKYVTLVTSIFLHFGIQHLLNNMVVLSWSGWTLEQAVGSVRMILIYLFSGICGNILSCLVDFWRNDYSVSAGASGAIFGLTGALLFIAMRNKGSVYGITKRSLMILIGLNLYIGYTSGGVDNAAHLGGLIGGFILSIILCFRKLDNGKRYKKSRPQI